MHSMPAVGVHPSQKWLAMQSLDNQILIYSSPDLKQNRKKRFAGHSTAGHACEVAFSPDGKYLTSGDSDGSLVVWDFKNSEFISDRVCSARLNAYYHNQVVYLSASRRIRKLSLHMHGCRTRQ
jgi:WD40 repeat protein